MRTAIERIRWMVDQRLEADDALLLADHDVHNLLQGVLGRLGGVWAAGVVAVQEREGRSAGKAPLDVRPMRIKAGEMMARQSNHHRHPNQYFPQKISVIRLNLESRYEINF